MALWTKRTIYEANGMFIKGMPKRKYVTRMFQNRKALSAIIINKYTDR